MLNDHVWYRFDKHDKPSNSLTLPSQGINPENNQQNWISEHMAITHGFLLILLSMCTFSNLSAQMHLLKEWISCLLVWEDEGEMVGKGTEDDNEPNIESMAGFKLLLI